jgi:hypothetical protein
MGGITLDTHKDVHGPSHQERPSPQDQAAQGTTQVSVRRKTT